MLALTVASVWALAALFLMSPVTAATQGKIVFIRPVGVDYQIYTMEPDGTNQTQLTGGPGGRARPSFAPDGTRIVFDSFTGSGNPDIYVMNADGTNTIRLTNHTGHDYQASFSPDGSKIVFLSDRDGKLEVYVMNADGTDQARLTDNDCQEQEPSFSADGSKILVEARCNFVRDIYAIDMGGTVLNNLTPNSESDCCSSDFRPAFSPDGSKVVFASDRDGTYELYIMNADGTNPARLTFTGRDDEPSFSPDGSKIIFSSTRDGGFGEIYVMSTDGSSQTRLTLDGGFSPSWWGPVPTPTPTPTPTPPPTPMPTPTPDITSFVVNSTNDPGAGGCDAAECTLREAIAAANADAGTETITFDIPGDGPHTIQLSTALPALSQSVNINNTSGESLTVRGEGSADPYRVFTIFDGTVTISGLTISNGGGIFNNGTLNLTNSTVTGNRAESGGGVYNQGTLNLTNSTVSGNSAEVSGGGIYHYSDDIADKLTLASTTVTNNSVDDRGFGGSGIYFEGLSVSVLLRNSIVATNYISSLPTNDIQGDGVIDPASSYNLVGACMVCPPTGGTNNNQVGVTNPGLGPLASNGGPTQTHALLPGSPAIDKGNGFGLAKDQRGYLRPVDAPSVANAADGSDIGAYEDVGGRVLRIVGTDNAAADAPVTLPVELVSLGDENTIVFSLTFDPALLSNPQVSLGQDAAGATLLVNASQASQGRFGVALALPAGQSFIQGTRHLLNVTFRTEAAGATTTTLINFGDQPLMREVADVKAHPASADYVPGSVTLRGGFESDVAPRPHGSNSGMITATDWAQTGRFAAGLDTAAPGSEFQRADSAPRTEPEVRGPDPLGDGVISPADWVQAGRYAALLDPPTRAGGPTAPAQQQQASLVKAEGSAALTAEGAVAEATVRLAGTSFVPGQANTLTVEMEAAEGGVNALGFSLAFDPAHLTFLSARLSEEAEGRGATLTVNQLGASSGRLGFLLGLPAGQTFPPGVQQLVKVSFGAPAQPSVASTQVGFDGRVVVREVVDMRARTLPSSFVAAAVTFGGSSMQFGASRYLVRESDGAAHITITRSGNVSGVATIDYATSDATASERQDYMTTLGTLRFEAGEQSKTLTVPVVDDAKAEGEQSFLLKLSNATGNASLSGADSVEVIIADDDLTDSGANPADSTEFFVRQHYQDFLSREPDAAGLAFWTQGIDSCGTDAICREVKRIDTSAAFFLSIEYQQTGYLAYRLRRATFNRLPLYRELLRDTQEIGREVVVGSAGWEQRLEDNKREFARAWVGRPEVLAQLPADMTAAQFVDRLFTNTGATPTTSERDAALAAFGAGGVEGRAAALRSVVESGSVYNRQYNSAFVLMQYVGYLRRNPSDAPDADWTGYNFWLAKLDGFSLPGEDVRDPATAQRRVQRAEMVRAFLVSDEYRQRFGR